MTLEVDSVAFIVVVTGWGFAVVVTGRDLVVTGPVVVKLTVVMGRD